LKKTQAHITIWGLLVASKPHRTAFIKLLDYAIISPDSTPEQLPNMIGSLTVQKSLSVSDEDLSPLGKKHSLALYITVRTREKILPQVLIDNGSTINVCPLKTARCLGISDTELSPSVVTVKAYDNTKRAVLGSLKLDLMVGPGNFSADFQIKDIPSSFNLLLGRAWLHYMGALPSSLHQKIKIPFEGKIITIQGDPERTLADFELPVLGIGSQSIQLGASPTNLKYKLSPPRESSIFPLIISLASAPRSQIC